MNATIRKELFRATEEREALHERLRAAEADGDLDAVGRIQRQLVRVYERIRRLEGTRRPKPYPNRRAG